LVIAYEAVAKALEQAGRQEEAAAIRAYLPGLAAKS
jgi:hypothetical protein